MKIHKYEREKSISLLHTLSNLYNSPESLTDTRIHSCSHLGTLQRHENITDIKLGQADVFNYNFSA